MMKRLVLTLGLPCFLGACTHTSPNPDALDATQTIVPGKETPEMIQRIAFGSCNKTQLPQPLFRKVAMDKPQLWIWTGDAVYGDTRDMAVLSDLYARQLQQPEYAAFLQSGVKVIGTYDDHDFGENNAGRNYPARQQSMQLFLDFVNEPKDSPRRQQEGLYTRYRMGPEGRRVKILLTDNRYNREKPGQDTDLLGAAQWAWLEKELMQVDAELLLIVSGTQILPHEHRYEKWADWPASRQKLLDLMNRSPYANIVLISGDRHLAEVSQMDLPSGKRIMEVTSSGLTHSYTKATDAISPNSLRTGALMNRMNYGLLDIVWTGTNPQVRMEVRDINRDSIIQASLPLKRNPR